MSNAIFDLPSGARCVRVDDESRRYVFSAAGATLTVADVEALYADSISADGGVPACVRVLGGACGYHQLAGADVHGGCGSGWTRACRAENCCQGRAVAGHGR